jgi:hypothetical protein
LNVQTFSATIGHPEVAMLTYKVIELATVSEEMIEEALNEWTVKGWNFDGVHFAMRESQKRPSMAFIIFTREEGA